MQSRGRYQSKHNLTRSINKIGLDKKNNRIQIKVVLFSTSNQMDAGRLMRTNNLS